MPSKYSSKFGLSSRGKRTKIQDLCGKSLTAAHSNLQINNTKLLLVSSFCWINHAIRNDHLMTFILVQNSDTGKAIERENSWPWLDNDIDSSFLNLDRIFNLLLVRFRQHLRWKQNHPGTFWRSCKTNRHLGSQRNQWNNFCLWSNVKWKGKVNNMKF